MPFTVWTMVEPLNTAPRQPFKGEFSRIQIMENELESLSDREGHDGHLAEKFLEKCIPSLSYSVYCVAIRLSLLGNS